MSLYEYKLPSLKDKIRGQEEEAREVKKVQTTEDKSEDKSEDKKVIKKVRRLSK